jgi:hypothetical protein
MKHSQVTSKIKCSMFGIQSKFMSRAKTQQNNSQTVAKSTYRKTPTSDRDDGSNRRRKPVARRRILMSEKAEEAMSAISR